MDVRLIPLTETGAFHVRRLRLNRPQLVALRLRRHRSSVVEHENELLADELRGIVSEQERLMLLVSQALDGDDDALRDLRALLRATRA